MPWKQADWSGWGRALTASGQLARPERQSTLAALMRDTPAPAIGSCRSYGDACLNDGGRAVRTTRLDRVLSIDPEAATVTVEAGVTLGDLTRLLAPRGLLPAVLPGTGFATVGGAIAMDVHGKNHHHAGSFGQHVLSLRLLTPGGPVEVTPGSDLFAATVGGLGQTGIIAEATLRVLKCKGDVMVVTERRVPRWDDFLTALDRSDASYCVGWIDATATGDRLGRGILEEGETGAGLIPPPGRARRVPFDAPSAALSPPVVRAFNAAYYGRVPRGGRTVVRRIGEYFFPLDRIHDWNRLYGKRGFHQFQCVVPVAAAPALRQMLERIAHSGLASPLAVLKRMGPGRAGHLSFPMEGYTLACDFRNTPDAVALIETLEDATQEAGGRVYLAKDALATGAAVRSMYPDHGDWLREVERVDPEGTMTTDLVRRLGLRDAA
ncbi:FAD-binding protein [Palleronia pelagia]|uniref:Decaprenylphospho-beta-D-ribofuranose 2-oxidase n=1 Tax=Palleronia pelagia TaxID=387096 RepID=A0A1H8JFX0_9RHOB|nr:FAD-binding oxidoreductase [Palleronia pelagia]SEN79117.1 decaprenylphospho-beta-D-ribofuranose 2-oxidase [Palleronia pelagia]